MEDLRVRQLHLQVDQERTCHQMMRRASQIVSVKVKSAATRLTPNDQQHRKSGANVHVVSNWFFIGSFVYFVVNCERCWTLLTFVVQTELNS